MIRDAEQDLIAWNERKNRKPLILMGARQVGKTWLMNDFAAKHYPNRTVCVNLMKEDLIREAIESSDIDPQSIIGIIELKKRVTIIPGETLLILDEIQESPRALTSLKFFNEEMPKLAVMAAGSLLGLSLRRGSNHRNGRVRGSFPVGKVDFLDVRPMTFFEFLRATGEERKLEALKDRKWKLVSLAHEDYVKHLKSYLFVGGMPEAVREFVETHDYHAVRRVQGAILRAYGKDFEKHAEGALLEKIRLLWNNVPAQLAKENRKFIYKTLREGARAREYEVALQWLDDAAMVHVVRRVSPPRIPLKANEDFGAFKLYVHDVGLLGALSRLEPQTLLEGSAIFTNFKGALTEQYVLQELSATDVPLAYWASERGDAEVDFVLQGAKDVFPVEAKAARNLKAQSLKTYASVFNPGRCYRTSLERQSEGVRITDIPLYAVSLLAEDVGKEHGNG